MRLRPQRLYHHSLLHYLVVASPPPGQLFLPLSRAAAIARGALSFWVQSLLLSAPSGLATGSVPGVMSWGANASVWVFLSTFNLRVAC